MNETEIFNMRVLLKQIVVTVQLLSEETAQLVQGYHLPRTADHAQQTIHDRADALRAAAADMTEAAHKALNKTDQSEA